MSAHKDKTGTRYGKLLVTSYIGRDEEKRHLWKLDCDCGGMKILPTSSLGKSKSCGCLRSKKRKNWFVREKDREKALLRREYLKLITRNGKYKERIMSYSDYKTIVKKRCVYCGRTHSRTLIDNLTNKQVKINGIDRIDSNKGYNLENSEPCCMTCNRAKNTMTKEEFLRWVSKVVINRRNQMKDCLSCKKMSRCVCIDCIDNIYCQKSCEKSEALNACKDWTERYQKSNYL